MSLQEIKNNNKSWGKTFKNAFAGLIYAFTTQRNFIIHLILSLLAIVLALWLEVSFEKLILLIFAIVFGLAIEMANTTFEKTVDLMTEEFNQKAKIAKDLAAGMMLVASLGMAIIGFLILFPPLWQRIMG